MFLPVRAPTLKLQRQRAGRFVAFMRKFND
jgi:hypothetical protein